VTDDSENEIQSNLLHVHVCIQCSHALWPEDLDSRQVASGVIRCPKCGVAGPLNIEIGEIKKLDSLDSGLRSNGSASLLPQFVDEVPPYSLISASLHSNERRGSSRRADCRCLAAVKYHILYLL
jgi:DNA-directed RNA polymerase subunit RPC12/RpoP